MSMGGKRGVMNDENSLLGVGGGGMPFGHVCEKKNYSS